MGKGKLIPETVRKFNADFQNNESFIHTLSLCNKWVTELFSVLPELIYEINKFCTKKEDLEQFSVEHTINYIVGEILPSTCGGMKSDLIGDNKHPSA